MIPDEANGQNEPSSGIGPASRGGDSVDDRSGASDGVAARANSPWQAAGIFGFLKSPPASDTCEVQSPESAEHYKVTFTYKSWRGIVSDRTVFPLGLLFGSNEWHPVPQWLLQAFDCDKNELRYFAMKDISNWRCGDVKSLLRG